MHTSLGTWGPPSEHTYEDVSMAPGIQAIIKRRRYGIRLGLIEPLVLLELAALADQLLLGIAEVAGGASMVAGAD